MITPAEFSKALHDLGLTYAQEILIKQYIRDYLIKNIYEKVSNGGFVPLMSSYKALDVYKTQLIKALGEE